MKFNEKTKIRNEYWRKLGYRCGKLDGKKVKFHIKKFQRDKGMTVNGETNNKLEVSVVNETIFAYRSSLCLQTLFILIKYTCRMLLFGKFALGENL